MYVSNKQNLFINIFVWWMFQLFLFILSNFLMPQTDVMTYFFLVQNFIYWFFLVYIFGLLYCYLNFFNSIKFFFFKEFLTSLNKFKFNVNIFKLKKYSLIFFTPINWSGCEIYLVVIIFVLLHIIFFSENNPFVDVWNRIKKLYEKTNKKNRLKKSIVFFGLLFLVFHYKLIILSFYLLIFLSGLIAYSYFLAKLFIFKENFILGDKFSIITNKLYKVTDSFYYIYYNEEEVDDLDRDHIYSMYFKIWKVVIRSSLTPFILSWYFSHKLIELGFKIKSKSLKSSRLNSSLLINIIIKRSFSITFIPIWLLGWVLRFIEISIDFIQSKNPAVDCMYNRYLNEIAEALPSRFKLYQKSITFDCYYKINER